MQIAEMIKSAGVVGAGGGGFPTHVKAQSQVEYVLVNGAECEPLIHKDVELMTHRSAEILDGLRLLMQSTGATRGVVGIKKKNGRAVEVFRGALAGTELEVLELGDFYPAGDEYELVQLATGRLIPPGGIPLDVGCVVSNVETLFNIGMAAKDSPVTHKFVSVAGLVHEPKSFWVPIGTSYRKLLDFAGGTTQSDFVMLVSGVLMGGFSTDLDEVVTKTCAGLIVLPANHYLVSRKTRSTEQMNRIGKSACDQCTACTEFCPRYLLGYDIQPHKVMRSLGFTTSGTDYWNKFATYCCSCGLCTLYACPEELFPREACEQAKTSMREAGQKYQQVKAPRIHSMKDYRRVPTKSLLRRLRIAKYELPTPFADGFPAPDEVRIMLQQHAGKPAVPGVKVGTNVQVNDLLADIPEDSLGARIHASLTGKVSEVTDEYICIITDAVVKSGGDTV
ncbi:MAG: 4Fe-4S dicluster domain-containing protein [Desulfuromusa sp.]|nr:4Fe-4S dicluster domain-containing protein [Desulfuromusa sp.]